MRWFLRCTKALLLIAGAAPLLATAADFSSSGFATVGYAISDEQAKYLRYIDDRGTFKADSLVGIQGEARFSPQWSATIQVIGSAPQTRDSGIEGTVRWAFVSFRPSNEWLFRIGRLRPPVLIHTQNSEVGVTYDQVRLPAEVYSLSPVYDADGGALTKTWQLERGELNLDAYWGRRDTKFRLPFQRDAGQAAYFNEKIVFKGIVLSYAPDSLLLRAGLHHATVKPNGDQALFETINPLLLPGPFGGTLFVPSNALARDHVLAITLGADWRMRDWRITAEYGQRILDKNDLGPESKSGYVTVAHDVGKWTPYATHARMLSGSKQRTLSQVLNATAVPLGAQLPPPLGLGLAANYHRMLADQVFVVDQHSTMLGAAYSFSSTSKLKFEWMRTSVGLTSAFVDGDIPNKSFNIFSVAYAVAF